MVPFRVTASKGGDVRIQAGGKEYSPPQISALVLEKLKKAAELGFLRQVRGQGDQWEVRRILKAYVDAETLSDFAAKLRQYAGTVAADA